MIDTRGRPRLGPYVLLRPLTPCRHGERWLGVHELRHDTHTLYKVRACLDRAEQRRFLDAMGALSRREHPHLLPVEEFCLGTWGDGWAVTPYTGHQAGLQTLGDLRDAKGERMLPQEVERAVIHLLEAVAYAHAGGACHGPIGFDEILVDRFGSVQIEMYGLSRLLQGLPMWEPEAARDEVRSVVESAYHMLTGLRPEAPVVPAGRLVRRLPREWSDWLERGLDPAAGFAGAEEALAFLPSFRRGVAGGLRSSGVRSMLELLRPARRAAEAGAAR